MSLDTTTITKVLAANYAAAAAAEAQQINLAVGTALGAETDAKKALTLMQAASVIRATLS